MILLMAAALAAAPPRAHDDDDDERPRRHVVRKQSRDDDDDKPAKPDGGPATPGAAAVSAPVPPGNAAPAAPTQADPDERGSTARAGGGDDDEERGGPDNAITVTARRLDAARATIEPSLGASTYTLTNDAIENRPGGETRNLGSVLLQAPGVGRDARGALVVRGSSGRLQYRLNNIILPDGAGDFGEALSARLADRTELVTGALPAQYGLAPAGVVNVTTKNGHYLAGGQAELYGGSHGTIEPAVEWSHAAGGTSLFLSGSGQRSDIGLPAPDGRGDPLHDGRRELEGFGFLDHVIGATSRVSLIAGSVNERSQIPALAIAGLAGSERRLGEISSHHHYAIGAYQLSDGAWSLQTSLFALAASGDVRPDEPLRLAADGQSFARHDRQRSAGSQVEASYSRGPHVLRGGFVASAERLDRRERLATPAGATEQSSRARRTTVSLYGEDEWTLAPQLTANLGLRGDSVGGTDGRMHVQPRASLVWAAPSGLSAHVGYARSIVAAPLDDLAALAGSLRRVERDRLFDLGLQRKAGGLTLGIDAYDRRARDFIATRFRPDAPVGDAFSYAKARLRGVELVAILSRGPLNAWGNLSLARATATGLSGGAADLPAATAAYLAGHRVPLDSDQRLTLSAGASYRLGPVLLSASLLAGSSPVRTEPGGVPNGGRGPAYATADLAAVWHLKLIEDRPTDLRLDVRNLADRRYSLSDGSGIGGGAPGWNEPRGVYVGVEQSF